MPQYFYTYCYDPCESHKIKIHKKENKLFILTRKISKWCEL